MVFGNWIKSCVLGCLAIAMVACGSGNRKGGKDVIAVTNGEQEWLLEQLLGDDPDVEIARLLPPGADSEHFEPSIETMRSLGEAKSWLYMATPGFEEQLLTKIQSNFPNLEIADVSEGIDRNVSHFHHHEEAEGHGHDDGKEKESDPHLLTSLRNARIMASNMAFRLRSAYPEKAVSIGARHAKLDQRLKALDDSLKNIFDDRREAFLIPHPSLGYFARDYGLHQIAIEQTHREASPAQRAEAYAEAVAHGARVIVIEKEHPAPGIKELAKDGRLRVVEISLGGKDYLLPFRILGRELGGK